MLSDKERKNEYMRAWRRANPEKVKVLAKRQRNTKKRKDYYREYEKKYADKIREYRKKSYQKRKDKGEFKKKSKAQGACSYAIKTGKIKKRNICEICYEFPTECHHEDYSKPLDFIELCRRCHRYLHNS